MAETKRLFNAGVSSGAIQGDGVIVGVGSGWRLMTAPPKTSTSTHSIIFWEPEDAFDLKPTLEKVVRTCFVALCVLTNCVKVGACIHGAQHESPIFGDPRSDNIRLQCAAAVHNLQ
jgi:hypothetical protein